MNTDILTTDEILKEFNDNIKEITLDLSGNVLSDVNHDQFVTKENNATGELKYYIDENEYLPLFLSLVLISLAFNPLPTHLAFIFRIFRHSSIKSLIE